MFLEFSVDKTIDKAKNCRTNALWNVWECP